MERLFIFCLAAAFLLAGCDPDLRKVTENPDVSDQFTGMLTGEALGCNDFEIFQHNDQLTHYMVIEGDTESLLPDTEPATYQVSDTPGLNIIVDYYVTEDATEYTGCHMYCNDLVCPGWDEFEKLEVRTWHATSGRVTLQRTEINEDAPDTESSYEMDVILEDIIFDMGVTGWLLIDYLEINDVRVGWLPG